MGLDTFRRFSLYESMTLPELCDSLEDLEDERTPWGWTPRVATHRSSVERRILEVVVGARRASGPAVRCHLDVEVRAATGAARGVVRELAPGGIVVEAIGAWPEGAAIELRAAEPGADDRALRVRGVAATGRDGRLVVTFPAPLDEAEERRVRRFVLEAIRHRTAWTLRGTRA